MCQYGVNKQMQDHFKPVYEDLYKKLDMTFTGFLNEFIPRPMLSDTEEEREANFERIWNTGGFSFLRESRHTLLTFLIWLCSGQLQGSFR